MIVGLTGGIGSGKTTVLKMFQDKNIPVFESDKEARGLMLTTEVRLAIQKLFGPESYREKEPDRAYIASIVFNNKKALDALNKIIHPAVQKHFRQWYKKQHSPYVIKEAAILFESGGAKECDAIILVTAPEEVRVQRVIDRDHVDREAVLSRMRNQWPDEEKSKNSDYIIENINLKDTQALIDKIHSDLLKKSKHKTEF